MGAITEIVRRYVPGSYRAMIGASGTAYYSVSDLQNITDYVKFRLFATVVDTIAEATVYDPLLVNFIGKLTTLQFIPAAVDYWGDQLVSETTRGTDEVVSYLDRRLGLWKIFDDLRAEVNSEYDGMAEKYGFVLYGLQGMLPQVSYGDNGRHILRTGDPDRWPREGRRPGTNIYGLPIWGDFE